MTGTFWEVPVALNPTTPASDWRGIRALADPLCYGCGGTGKGVGTHACPCTQHSRDCDDVCAPNCPSTLDTEGRRCDCCDGEDGDGIWHFATIDLFWRWARSADSTEDGEVSIEGKNEWEFHWFDNRDEALCWLEERDARADEGDLVDAIGNPRRTVL